jgi:hypothetical protein
MAIHNRRQNLFNKRGGDPFIIVLQLYDPVKQLPALAVFHNDVVVEIILEKFMYPHNIRVVEALQNVDFGEQPIFFFSFYRCFLDLFHRF